MAAIGTTSTINRFVWMSIYVVYYNISICRSRIIFNCITIHPTKHRTIIISISESLNFINKVARDIRSLAIVVMESTGKKSASVMKQEDMDMSESVGNMLDRPDSLDCSIPRSVKVSVHYIFRCELKCIIKMLIISVFNFHSSLCSLLIDHQQKSKPHGNNKQSQRLRYPNSIEWSWDDQRRIYWRAIKAKRAGFDGPQRRLPVRHIRAITSARPGINGRRVPTLPFYRTGQLSARKVNYQNPARRL